MPIENQGGSKTTWIIAVVVGVVLVILAAAFFTWRYFQGKGVEETANQVMDGTINSSTTKSSSGKIDQNLVGTWDTGCLVPDPNSPWAEEHKFVISANGKAVHTRSSGESCAGLRSDGDQNYTITIPTKDQINLSSSEGTIYDIYSVAGNDLYFGHGFCSCSNAGSINGGATEAGRFTRLNQFLKYQKK